MPDLSFIRTMTTEGLRWDLGCNISAEIKTAMRAELERRGEPEVGMAIREDGPFMTGQKWHRMHRTHEGGVSHA